MFENLRSWYFGLPLWGKILGFTVFILLVLLAISRFLLGIRETPRTKSDNIHEQGTDSSIERGKTKDKQLAQEIENSENALTEIEDKKEQVTNKANDLHGQIETARLFSEVDKALKKLSIFVLVLLVPFALKAEEYTMPTGKDVVVNGVAMRAFTLDEYKTLANIYVDYRAFLDLKGKTDQELALYLKMKSLYEQRDENCKGMLVTLTTDRDYWKTRLTEVTTDKSHTIERWGLIAGIVVEAAALVVWGVYSVAQ